MPIEDFKIRISGAVLDKQIGSQLKAQLKEINDLAINVNHIQLSQSAIAEIKNVLTLNKITLQADLESSNMKQQAQVIGKNIGSIISSSAQKAISNINYAINIGKPQTQLATLEAQFRRLGISNDEVTDSINQVKTALISLCAEGQDEKTLITNQNKFNQALDISTNKVKQLSLDINTINPDKRMAFSNSMTNWLQKNTAAAKMCGKEVEYLIRECKTCDSVKFNKLKSQFISVQNSARAAGKLGKSLSDSLESAASSFTQWISVTSVIMQGVQTLREMARAVYDVNTATIELIKVSDAPLSEIANYFDKAAKNAKELGASISDVINATADWSRLGYNLPDSEELAKVAVLYKNVGDGIDIDKANKSLISTLKGFQMEAKDAIKIVDQFNEVDILAS